MSVKDKKQFGVWMDSHSATIVGKDDVDNGEFIILGNIKNVEPDSKFEKTANNQEIGLTRQFFKEIASKMPNIDEIHVTGTGQVQEQFIKFLSETPQYKNALSSESTSTKMSDEDFALFVIKHFN